MAWEKFEYAETDTVLPAYICIIDEYAEFVDNQPREKMRSVDTLQDNIQSIARLGRASHIHLLIATQSSSGNLFPPTLKNNVQMRTICGRVDGTVSRMAIDTEEGEAIPTTPGAYLGWTKGDTQSYQGWFTKTEKVLSLGTVKEGFDPKTGLEVGGEDQVDFSNLGTYQEPEPENTLDNSEQEENTGLEEVDLNAEIPEENIENNSVSEAPPIPEIPAEEIPTETQNSAPISQQENQPTGTEQQAQSPAVINIDQTQVDSALNNAFNITEGISQNEQSQQPTPQNQQNNIFNIQVNNKQAETTPNSIPEPVTNNAEPTPNIPEPIQQIPTEEAPTQNNTEEENKPESKNNFSFNIISG